MIDISVLLPVRDWDLKRVDLCLRSIEASNGCTVEVVVVDYGSRDPDGVRRLALQHGCTFTRVEAAEWSRSNAMNTAALMSSGRNLIFADADLVFAPTVLPATVQKLDSSRNTVLVFQVRDLPSTIKPSDLMDRRNFDYLESQAVWRPQWGMGIQAQSRRAFECIRGFDDRMKIYGGEDNDLAKRARGNGYRLEWVNSAAFRLYHVWHPSSREAAELDPIANAVLEENAVIAKTDRTTVRNLSSWRGSDPLVSVVISTYNRAEYLAESIRSVLRQTCQDFELLIMDDGSTDGTHEVVESLDDGRIRYFKESRQGIPVLRNKALELSRGRYTAIHDDDDIMLPWSLEARLRVLEPGVAGSYGGAFDFDNQSGAMRLFAGRQAEPSSVAEGRVFYHATLLIETDALRAVRYDESFQSGSDFNLAQRLMKVGFRLAHCGDVVLLRRIHKGQVTVLDQAIQHGASYATSFSQRATWTPTGLRKSRDRSKELGNWEYDEHLLEQPRFLPYLPDHLVRRAVVVRRCGDAQLPNGAIAGEIIDSGDIVHAAFINEVDADQLWTSKNSECCLFVHAERAEDNDPKLRTMQAMIHAAYRGRRLVTINPHHLDVGFAIVVLDDASEISNAVHLSETRCYFVIVAEDVPDGHILGQVASMCTLAPATIS